MPKLKVYPLSCCVRYRFYCPGCKCDHSYDCRTDGGRPSWTFNGDLELPTFTPSLLYPDRVCHLFVTDGRIQYLGDCTHELAGHQVDLPEIEPDSP